MATYKVTDPKTGKTLVLTTQRDAPPTKQELEHIFATYPTTQQPRNQPKTAIDYQPETPGTPASHLLVLPVLLGVVILGGVIAYANSAKHATFRWWLKWGAGLAATILGWAIMMYLGITPAEVSSSQFRINMAFGLGITTFGIIVIIVLLTSAFRKIWSSR